MADRLETLHRKLDDLTDPEGEYAVVCPRSGKRPVPVRGKSFSSPEAAAEAVDLVVAYRDLLRDVDPHLENVPIVACAEAADPLSLDVSEEWAARERASRDHGGRGRSNGRASAREDDRDASATVTLSGDGDDEWLQMIGAPVVRVREDGEPLDDAVVGLELNAKL